MSPFPPVLQDVAVVVDKAVPAAIVEAALRAGGGDLLEDVRLFDVFEGTQVGGEDRKSLAFALRFRAPDRTLTEDERARRVTRGGFRVGCCGSSAARMTIGGTHVTVGGVCVPTVSLRSPVSAIGRILRVSRRTVRAGNPRRPNSVASPPPMHDVRRSLET